MFKFQYVGLFFLLFVAGKVLSKPMYLFNYDARGWLKMHMVPATWEEAFLRCHYEGAVLASPLDRPLANALVSVMSRNRVERSIHLGIHSLFSKGDFASVEGVPLSDMEIIWGAVGDGQCLTMSIYGQEYRMATESCNDSRPFICYKTLGNETINDCGTFDNNYHLNQRTGSCYKLHEQKVSWFTAHKICASEGGYLVILNDKEEARIVKDMFPVYSGTVNQWDKIPVGLLAWSKDRIWTTIHGERIEDVFHDWHPGQPDNYEGVQDRAYFLRAGTLDDERGAEFRSIFVCEKSPHAVLFDASPPGTEELPSPYVV